MDAFVLGAGFAKSADLPVQSEITDRLVADGFTGRIDRLITAALSEFLADVFGWRPGRPVPALEDVFTCLDLSADAGHRLGRRYPPPRLRALQRIAMYRIFSILDRPPVESREILRLLAGRCAGGSAPRRCGFAVLNWDDVLETHLRRLAPGAGIDYGCPIWDWSAPHAVPRAGGVPVCKMHGSSTWLYCDNCRSLFYDLDRRLPLPARAGLRAGDLRLWEAGLEDDELDRLLGVSAADRACRFCGSEVGPHVATFSYRKSFGTAAYQATWYQAERLLAAADRWIFIGYSLPEADDELKHLLKSAQARFAHQRRGGVRVEAIVRGDPSAQEKFERFFGVSLAGVWDGGLAEYVDRLAA